MKKIRRTIIIVSVVICAALAAVTGYYLMKDRAVSVPEPDRATMDAYLLSGEKEKAPERVNAVCITDGTDGSFVDGDKTFKEALQIVRQSFFSEVCIDVPEKNCADDKERGERFAFAVSEVKTLGKKAYICISDSDDISVLAEYIGEADGVLLSSSKSTAEYINSTASAVKDSLKNKKLIISFAADYEDIGGLDKELIDEIRLVLSKEGDGERLLGEDGKKHGIPLSCELDLGAVDGKKITADVPLKNLYALKKAENVSAVSFGSLKNVKENFNNCFGAVTTYINTGIVAELAFRQTGVDCDESGIISAEGYIGEASIYGSYLYPFFIDDENVGMSDNGNITVNVDLEPGENKFTVSQNGSFAEFKMISECKQELVRSVIPMEDLYLLPGESFYVTVIAHCKAEIFVKFGTQTIEAKSESTATGYTSFTAAVTAPKTESEISSVGSLSVVASYGEKSVKYEGAKVFPAEVIPETTARPTTTLDAGNYNPTVTDDEYEITQGTTLPTQINQNNQNNQSTTASQETEQPPESIIITPNTMCIVKEPLADAKLLSANDDYSPSCSPLVGGTMDYVVAESTYYNYDDEKEEYYFDLASGRKIKREFVDIVERPGMGDNSLEVVSVSADKGKLKITLKTAWRVPYNIDYPGQNYYYSFYKRFNVTSFNASSVRMTFYHTASVSGNVDVTGSNVLSSAQWTTSQQEKTATLTFNLKNQGQYYGTSVEYDDNGNMVITFNRKPDAQTGYVVLLDPGHGGSEPGAVGLGSTVQERQINLDPKLLSYVS